MTLYTDPMPVTKSGIETPTVPPKESLEVPVKVYPGSGQLGRRADKSGKGGGMVKGPLDCK